MKLKSSLLLHYVLSAVIIIGIISLVAWYATDRFEAFFIEQAKSSLKSRAINISEHIATDIKKSDCTQLKKSDPNIRITIINAQGVVLCDANVDASTMENHGHRPEVAKALSGQSGSIIRFSATVKTSYLYVAIPWLDQRDVIGVIRAAQPLNDINNLLSNLFRDFYILLLGLLVCISAAILYSYRKINKPIAEIINSTQKLVSEGYKKPIAHYDIYEIDQLGQALNNTFEQIERLENLRQEFVGNVSHELKTPIATIQSYAETLLDGAANDPKDLKRFLEIILKQNHRLANIVNDLLQLSKLEHVPSEQLLQCQPSRLLDIINNAKELCLARADAKHIDIKVQCKKKLMVNVDQSLFEQAISNLLDNAIKYSPNDTEIKVQVNQDKEQITLKVIDQGSGIEEKHFERLFERFYRVDKSRSRQEGGTGLGLAIVKHIIQIHNATIHVKNNQHQGCCFYIVMALKV